MSTDVKTYETKKAVEDGADEIDMVIPVGLLKAGEYVAVYEDIKTVRDACAGTGFSTGGATISDVALMKAHVEGKCKVKAAGGIRDYNTAAAMIDAGADRLGTSATIKIMEGRQ